MFHQKTTWDVIHEQAYCHDEAANHQLLIVAVFWIIRIVSMEECSSLTQNLIQICCFTCSFILNEMATQCTCLLNSIYHPHWLVQCSCHCSHAHSSPLFLAVRLHQCCANHYCYINNGWTFSGQTLSYIHVCLIFLMEDSKFSVFLHLRPSNFSF